MRIFSATLGLALLGCAANQQGIHLRQVTPPPLPAGIPETWDFKDAEALPAHRETAMAACSWLLDVAPASADSKQWVRARDYALDWVEAQTNPAVPVVNAVVRPPLMDRRFYYSVYMRIAYQCGKAPWVLANPPPAVGITELDMRGELAAVDGMLRLYAAVQAWDTKTRSPKLERYRRKKARGKLEAYLRKLIAKAARRGN